MSGKIIWYNNYLRTNLCQKMETVETIAAALPVQLIRINRFLCKKETRKASVHAAFRVFLLVRVFLRHLFKKVSNTKGLRAIKKQYLPLKIE
ncbi:hypothetical protein CAFE_02130 [Caprobacter fermentans]|uniref:Uncharacterized protein n=1 Tax=Caproicibacter fermentans TaxID=2576756 RepID=A0A6N8HVG8_9FIRM|nr:hypothetical protein [Caproicibacter fermentans]